VEGTGSGVIVVVGDGDGAAGDDVPDGEAEGVGSLVAGVVGAAVASSATNPRAVVAMASEAKAAESRLRVSPMDMSLYECRISATRL
jgi:hypothetical protein